MENYFKLPERAKMRAQEKVFRQMRLIQENHFEDEGERIPLKVFYRNAITQSAERDDFEMAQLLKDSAAKYMIDWNVK